MRAPSLIEKLSFYKSAGSTNNSLLHDIIFRSYFLPTLFSMFFSDVVFRCIFGKKGSENLVLFFALQQRIFAFQTAHTGIHYRVSFSSGFCCHNQLPYPHRYQEKSETDAQQSVLRFTCEKCARKGKNTGGNYHPQNTFRLDQLVFGVNCKGDHAHRQETYEVYCLNCFLRNIQKGKQRHKQCAASHAHSPRSEERRVGKECRSRWSPYH